MSQSLIYNSTYPFSFRKCIIRSFTIDLDFPFPSNDLCSKFFLNCSHLLLKLMYDNIPNKAEFFVQSHITIKKHHFRKISVKFWGCFECKFNFGLDNVSIFFFHKNSISGFHDRFFFYKSLVNCFINEFFNMMKFSAFELRLLDLDFTENSLEGILNIFDFPGWMDVENVL